MGPNEEVIPNPDGCDPAKDCVPQVVETCKELWEAKLAECEANAEAWAGFCPAPKFTDHEGNLRDCKQGCCSEAMEDLHEEMEDEPCMMPCHECDTCHMETTDEDWQKADACFMEAESSAACQECHECDWTDMAHCEEVCTPCYDGFYHCEPCSATCTSCHHCWEEVHHVDEALPAEHEYEEGPCDGPCGACDECWTDEDMMANSTACYSEKANTTECTACHECDWADPEHCDAICSTCWEMEAECDVCSTTCESCSSCWDETHCEGSHLMSDDPCGDPCVACNTCYEGMTEADYEEAGQCYAAADETEECKACYEEDWGDYEAAEAKCVPCYEKLDACEKCTGECDACHSCYDDVHGEMDMSEMPMESEYVEGPCDGACSACDSCWSDPVVQDDAFACYEEKSAGVEACKECEECDWESDPAACEATCETCYAEVATCDPCMSDCDSCNDCWDSVSESTGPGPMDEMPMDMDSHEGHFCDSHGPDEFPCCKHQSREEQDACLEDKPHFCDSHSPEEYPCCQHQDRQEQDDCLTAAGVYPDEDTGAFGAAEPDLSMGGEEFHNVCHEPCIDCDMCNSDPANHEEWESCSEMKAASAECMSCDSCDWDDAESDCQSVCDTCWATYEECNVCRDACSPCDGCWEEQYPMDSAVHSEDNPCSEPCMPCDSCWMDPDAMSGMEGCYEEKDQSPECQECYACDWMTSPGECDEKCAPCYDSFQDCEVCVDECHGCHTCEEEVYAPNAADEWDQMAMLLTSKIQRTQKVLQPEKAAPPTQQCKLQKQSASRKSEVVAVARKHHLKSANSVMQTLFPKPQGRATKMRAMLEHLQRSSKSTVVRKRSGETLRALFSLKASKKAARHARTLRNVKKALQSKSNKTQAFGRKASKALRKAARKAKRYSKANAKQNVVRQLKRIREAQNGKKHTVVKKNLLKKGATRHAQHTNVRMKVMKLLYVQRRSSEKAGKKILRALFRKKGMGKMHSKVHHSKAMMAIKEKDAKKSNFIRMMFTLAHSKKAKARGFAHKAIHLVARTKALKGVQHSKAKRAKVFHSKVGKDAKTKASQHANLKVGLLRAVTQ